MNFCNNRDILLKGITVLGACLLRFSGGGIWTWGNMSVYSLSYLRQYGASRSELESPWLTSLFIIDMSVSMMVSGFICRLIGRRLTLLFGLLLQDGGIFLSALTVQYSLTALSLTTGVMTGFGTGIVYTMIWLFVIDWANGDEGILGSVIYASSTVGSAISIQIVSAYINPSNLSPTLSDGPLVYYTETSVTNKVPSAYLVLGTFSVACHVIGFAMLQNNPKAGARKVKQNSITLSENSPLEESQPTDSYHTVLDTEKKVESAALTTNIKSEISQTKTLPASSSELSAKDENKDEMLVNEKKIDPSVDEKKNIIGRLNANSLHRLRNQGKGIPKSSSSDAVVSENSEQRTTLNDQSKTSESADRSKSADHSSNSPNEEPNTLNCNGEGNDQTQIDSQKKKGRRGDYTPKQVLQDYLLYLLWVILICNDYGFIIFANYYKAFGEVYIHNDHNLSNLGSALTISIACTSPLWGLIIDKAGIKFAMLTFSALFSLLFSWIYFTPMVSQYLYYVVCTILACVDAGLYANFSVAALKFFGEKHFPFNIGLIMSSTIVLNIAAPLILKSILANLGWFYLFYTTALCNFFSLLLIIFFLPQA